MVVSIFERLHHAGERALDHHGDFRLLTDAQTQTGGENHAEVALEEKRIEVRSSRAGATRVKIKGVRLV